LNIRREHHASDNVRVGITLAGQHPIAGTELLLQVAEGMGAESVWMPDHILGVFHPGLWSDMAYSAMAADPDAFYDPFVVSGILGGMTDKAVGISVTDTTRRKAADLARTALTLQHLVPGGFILGVGSGEAESLTPFGYPFDTPVAECEKVLIELRSLLDTGRMPEDRGLSGRMGIPLASDKGKPEVWVAGHGPRMLRLTGQYGDGWLPAWPMSPEVYGEKRATIFEWASKAGRPNPTCSLLPFVMIGESKEYIAELMESDPLGKLFALFCPGYIWKARGFTHPFGDDSNGFVDIIIHDLDPEELRALAPEMPFELVEEVIFMGSPSDVAGRLQGYADNGLEHVVLCNLTGVVGGMVEIEKNMPGMFELNALLTAM
jgi:phthiodiolone/phenolphthiodiolone dimycocerosates ketoreductase